MTVRELIDLLINIRYKDLEIKVYSQNNGTRSDIVLVDELDGCVDLNIDD